MAKIKVIQVNIFKGKYLDALVDFLKREEPDFITMQEVTCGVVSNHLDKTTNLFEYLKNALGLSGVFHNDVQIANQPEALHGNAVFTKHKILESDHVVLKTSRPLTEEEFHDPKFFPDFPRSIVDASCDFNGELIHILSLHGAWTAPPTDTPETIRQARQIASHLKGLGAPFVLGGDLNMPPEKETTKIISAAANNLMVGSGVKQTTHPTIHKIAPRGFLIDYLFVSDDFKKIDLTVPEIIVSDHLPVIANLEFTSR